ncbi:MAG: hypothetical protein M3N19_10200 [Candidatus Eremiobacteraeota bacterium]|nr:hypothetical protein [Candidatus Eremiobacteraeota bacterium]
MTRAKFKLVLAVALLAALLVPLRAAADIVADPQILYTQMKAAYDKGQHHGWKFVDQEYYFETILNAGRAYSLQHPDDPNYGELAKLTVTVATGLHYNPLTNLNAVPWYVREAAGYVIAHGSTDDVKNATALLDRANAVTDPILEARLADEDATANLRDYGLDRDVLLQQVEAEWRAYVLTKDPSWRTLALQHAAAGYFPVEQLPTSYGDDFIAASRSAVAGVAGYGAGDVVNATKMLAHLKSVAPLRLIGTVNSQSHAGYLSTLAPADEYFGRLNMSILGMRNELRRINLYLDAGYGDRESNAGVFLAEAVDDLHRVYPRDRDLPVLLLQTYRTLQRMQSPESQKSAAVIRSILTIEYQDTQQARELLAS